MQLPADDAQYFGTLHIHVCAKLYVDVNAT